MKKYQVQPCTAAAALGTVAAAVLQLTSAPVYAQADPTQTDTAGTLKEITVTATRRATNLEKTPATVAALSGADLESRQITNLEGLAEAVPGVSFGGQLGEPNVAIRGIGANDVFPGDDPRIAVYQDGVYIARPTAQMGGLFDLERVEVLKGPQGALYGRNATGGAIIVISRQPTNMLSGYAHVSYGNYNTVDTDGAIGGLLSDTLAGRLAFQTANDDGYGRNITTGSPIDDENAASARASLRWRPTESSDFTLIYDYHREKDHGSALHLFGRAVGGIVYSGSQIVPVLGTALGYPYLLNSRDVASNVDPYDRVTTRGATGTGHYDFGWAKLTSITSYRTDDARNQQAIGGTAAPLAYADLGENARQVSEELQLAGDAARLHWLGGLSYFHENNTPSVVNPFSLAVFGGPLQYAQGFFIGGVLRTRGLAAYAQATYDLTDRLSLTAAARYNDEAKTIDDTFQFDLSRPFAPGNPIIPIPPFPRHAQKNYYATTPSAGLQFKFSPAVFGYLTLTQGFKSGGFNLGVDQPAFQPEKIWSLEAGLKSTLLDGRLRLNAAAFGYRYTDLQVTILRNTTVDIENAARANMYGLDADFAAIPFGGWRIDGSLSLLHSKYEDYRTANPDDVTGAVQDLSGNQMTQAPKVAVNIGTQYTWQLHAGGQMTLRGEYSWVSRVYFTPFDEQDVSQRAHGRANAFLSYESTAGKWSVSAYVRNLTNDMAASQLSVSTGLLGFPITGPLEPPRTFGVKAGYEF